MGLLIPQEETQEHIRLLIKENSVIKTQLIRGPEEVR